MDISPSTAAMRDSRSWLEVVRDQVGSLQFGHVQITVHNKQVVQVETTQRIRFSKSPHESETEKPG
jgi:hypothetical protein